MDYNRSAGTLRVWNGGQHQDIFVGIFSKSILRTYSGLSHAPASAYNEVRFFTDYVNKHPSRRDGNQLNKFHFWACFILNIVFQSVL